MDAASSLPFEEAVTPECESCGRTPARPITVRRHVGLLVLQRFVTVRVTACRPCGRGLIRTYTGKTLWQGWWGAISVFFNWFVLAANLNAWRRLGAIESPSLSGTFVAESSRDAGAFEEGSHEVSEAKPRRRSRLRTAGALLIPGFMAFGLIGWGWDATHHDHAEAHGAPAAAPALERVMNGGRFTTDDGSSVVVQTSSCAGEGEAAAGGYTHFRCHLGFEDGSADEVIVHLLEGDDLFFKSALG